MLPVADSPKHQRFDWLDSIKAIAMAWIIWNHIGEQFFGKPHLLSPSDNWGTLAARIEQLKPIAVSDYLSSIVMNAMRYVAWLGDHGVALFLIASGFGLAWSKLGQSQGRHYGERTDGAFWWRRIRRIYPTWFFAHLIFLLPPALIGWRVSVVDPEFYASLVALRVTPGTLYYGVPAWWFVALILQLYLLFPFVFRFLCRFERWEGIVAIIAVSIVARGLGLWYFYGYLDAWSRGAVFITRLPEFTFGIWLAIRLAKDFDSVHQSLMSVKTTLACSFGYAFAVAISVTLSGMVVAPFLGGVSVFVVFYRFTNSVFFTHGWFSRWIHPVIQWIGQHSLALYLVHHPIVFLLIPDGSQSVSWIQLLFRVVFVIAASVGATLFLEWLASTATQWTMDAVEKWGAAGATLRFGAACAAVLCVLLPVELLTRKYDPQDVPDFGWSERPSLQADAMFGYRMRPSTKVRLRWQGYDYVVQTNGEGFPGPDFSMEKKSGTCRIMTLGDAFTSAEGVDTAKAWPRLLQQRLRCELPDSENKNSVEVLNFGVTGFGPNQYAALVEEYAPRINPDLIVIGMFVNDFVDVLTSKEELREMIGFDRPKADCLLGYLTARHTFRWVRGNVLENAFERFTGRASPNTHFFCQLDALSLDRAEEMEIGRDLVRERFATIQSTAKSIGASVLVVNIPASLQVLDREQLSFLRPCVELGEVDMDQPQRITRELASEHGFAYVDLRGALRAVKHQQPYFSRNLHWTEVGHQAAVDGMMPLVRERLEMIHTEMHEVVSAYP